MAKKKGKGEGKETSDKWGDGVNWNTSDFIPAWNLDEVFRQVGYPSLLMNRLAESTF